MKIIGTYLTQAKVYNNNNKLIEIKDVHMIKFKADNFIFDIQLKLCKPLND